MRGVGLFHQPEHRPLGLSLQPIAMKTRFRPVLKRIDAALQLGGSLWIRGDSRTHRQRIGLGHLKHHVSSQAAFLLAAV
jgi:hypothetical protein